MQKNKTPKKKPYKSTVSNILWSFRGQLRHAPTAPVISLLTIPVSVFLHWAGIYLPSLVVAEVTEGQSVSHAALTVGGLLLAMLCAKLFRDALGFIRSSHMFRYRLETTRRAVYSALSCFYEDYESPETRNLQERAFRATEMWNGVQPLTDLPGHTVSFLENVLCYLLFGSVITVVSPWLVPILTVAPIVNWFSVRLYRKWEYSRRDYASDLDRRLVYATGKPADFTAAKDIRIYGLATWFSDIYNELSKKRARLTVECANRSFLSRIADLAVILLRDGAAYLLLIGMVERGELTAADCVLYFAAISSFATFLGGIISSFNGMHAMSLQISDFREFTEKTPQAASDNKPSCDARGDRTQARWVCSEPIAPHRSHASEIVFDRVSYRYKGAERDVLSDISFTLHAGESLALVGLNGAGKTTLVKLLCGLYRPTSGEIRLNGIPLDRFAPRELYTLFAPVFQDVRTAFFTVAETVSGKADSLLTEEECNRIRDCLLRAGLDEKISRLPEGIHTHTDKQLYAGGTDLSGGEKQKLMLARALYKDAPMLILDEPTAALDPLAESRIYEEYKQMADGKTTLFISHRLASTRFCDRIFYLKDGRIAEEGTHASLLAGDTEYARLYDMQSCWYREEESQNG